MAAEKEELVMRVEAQVVNLRDVDKIRREKHVVERNIAKGEKGKAALEEKGWEKEAMAIRKLEQIEGLSDKCNQALKKLKPSIDFQYMLNAKESILAEILGASYRTVMKPALNALADETKKISVSKLDESISLEKQLQGNVKILEERSRISILQANFEKMGDLLNALDIEIGNHISRCKSDGKQMEDQLEKEEHCLSIVEKVAE